MSCLETQHPSGPSTAVESSQGAVLLIAASHLLLKCCTASLLLFVVYGDNGTSLLFGQSQHGQRGRVWVLLSLTVVCRAWWWCFGPKQHDTVVSPAHRAPFGTQCQS
eukprot:GHUV01016776.1.p3 GENE.GHUV01016776.1~~GHUV01016776.1.p3  ORF type:complete len:107 (+),score=25.44 GHUV01016776.1:2015-2335(+)